MFARIEKRSNVKSRWIAVNTPAMSINHEPETAFEKKAAEELATLIDAWPRLPEPIKAGILVLIRTASE